MSLFDRLFSEEAALEPKRKPLSITKKFELGGSKPSPGRFDPTPLSTSMTKGASARPVATGKAGQVFGAKPSNRISQRFSEDLRTRFRRLFTELDAKPFAPPAPPVKPVVATPPPAPEPKSGKPDALKPESDKTPDVPKPASGPYKLGSQNDKTIPQNSYSEALKLIDGVINEAKRRGFVSQEISHLMHGKAKKGPLKGKQVPQKQAVAIALNVARRKGIK